jgi:hypothetical protein
VANVADTPPLLHNVLMLLCTLVQTAGVTHMVEAGGLAAALFVLRRCAAVAGTALADRDAAESADVTATACHTLSLLAALLAANPPACQVRGVGELWLFF